MWTCTKCKVLFVPNNHSRICFGCRNYLCIDCGADISPKRADSKRCAKCVYEHIKSKASAWYKNNKDKKRVYDEQRRINKRNLYRCASKRFRDNHPDKKNRDTAARRQFKRQATPAWANKFFMSQAYELAKMRTKMMGLRWHVDHVIPLRGKNVCGLHVETNLCVVPATANLAKNNSHDGIK